MEQTRKEMLFQFPPPRGGERHPDTPTHTPTQFQFPPPRGGERGPCSPWALGKDFNSRPREGANPSVFLVKKYVIIISIPAPARGRTCSCAVSPHSEEISIPAPARGRT